MGKKTKLTEKAARISEIRQTTWDEAINRYIDEIKGVKQRAGALTPLDGASSTTPWHRT